MKFVCDGMLGRLARWMRLAGFDTAYVNSRRPSDILGLARREERLILTRSTFLEAHEPGRVYRVSAEHSAGQLEEVVRHFNLKFEEGRFFTRCSLCNNLLERVEKKTIEKRIPAYVYRTQAEFFRCPSCDRIYWGGTHWEHIRKTLENLC